MTMTNFKCDVCGRDGAFGVASTLIPYSCAYCRECAERGAQPELVFQVWYDDVGTDFEKMAIVDEVVTFRDGKYLSYREWAIWREKQ
jgi:predicted metal-binding protein